MSKKILFWNTSKLATLSAVLLLLVFGVIGVSFRPVYDESEKAIIMNSPRQNHWYYEESGCGSSTMHYQSSVDYAETQVQTRGNGSVTISTTETTNVTSATSASTNTTAGNTATISWNSGLSHSDQTTAKYTNDQITAAHQKVFTIAAEPISEDYYFAGWGTSTNESSIDNWDNPRVVTSDMKITTYTNTSSEPSNYKNSGSPYTETYYAFFKLRTPAGITLKLPSNGTVSYAYESNPNTTLTAETTVTTKYDLTLVATPAEGYEFYGWYTLSGTTENYISYSAYFTRAYTTDITIYAKFLPAGSAYFIVKGVPSIQYYDFAKAITAASSSSSKVVLPIKDGIVPAGTYTIPSGVTLLIPYDADNTLYNASVKQLNSRTTPSVYRKLTLVSGVILNIEGKLEVGSYQSVQGQMNAACGAPDNKYGELVVKEGAQVNIMTGANFYAWGFVSGAGNVFVKSGGSVYESFILTDYRGGSITSNIYSYTFPLTQYYIQNVQVPMTYEAGSAGYTKTGLTASGSVYGASVQIIGSSSGAMFVMGSGSTVQKKYDYENDRQVFNVNGTASLNDISLSVAGNSVNSSSYVLPLTNNFTININSGTTTINCSALELTADAEINVAAGASAIIASGKKLIVDDLDEWGNYPGGAYIYPLADAYAPHRIGTRSQATMRDARIYVKGTLTAIGGLYTTVHGANIYSDDSGSSGGRIVLQSAAPSGSYTFYHAAGTSADALTKVSLSATAAQLHNADNSFTATSGAPASTTIDYKHGHWGWKVIWKLEDGTVLKSACYYKQPEDSWINNNKPSETHPDAGTSSCTYTFNGWDKTVNTANQEVEMVATFTRNCTNYYEVVWKSEDGSSVLETDASVGEGEATQFNGETPTKATDWTTYAEYEFDGWTTEASGAGTFYANGSTPVASANVTYYAHFAKKAMVASVTASGETTYYRTFAEAFDFANHKATSTITILNDNSGTNERLVYTVKDGNCTLDLNGHTTRGAVPYTSSSIIGGLIVINASGSTFTITDDSANKDGRLENICAQNQVTYGVLVTVGTLNVNAGIIHAENPAQYASKANTDLGVSEALTSCGARAVQISAAQKLNITGGRLESYATRNAYGIVATGNTANTTQITISGGEVYAEAPCGAYGISCTGKLDMSAGLVEAKLNDHLVDAAYAADNADYNLNKHQTCYTIIMGGSASATASSCYYGTLTVTGGTIKASSDLERSYTSNVYAIYMNVSVAGMGNRNFASTSGTNAEQACAVGSIKNATIDVLNKGNNAFGISVFGKYNSKDRTNTVFKVENTNITVKAYNYAYGVYANGGINSTTGECYTGDVEMTNCTVLAEAYKAAYAYPAFVYSGATTIFQEDQSNYYGEYATAAKMTINGGSYMAKAKTHYAYAAVANTRARSTYGPETKVYANRTQGGHAEAYPTLIINGGTFVAKTEQQHARGVSSGGNTTVTDATFHVTAGTYNTYGLYSISGKLTATNVIVNDTAMGQSSNNANVYGVLADCSIPAGNTAQTGFAYAGEVELNNCTITAVSPSYSNVRALYVNATNKLHNWTQFLADSTSNTGSWAANKNNYAALYRRVFPCTIEGRDSVSVAIAGKATVNGGTFTAKAGKATAYGAVSTQTSVPANREVTASPVMNLYNATFIAQTGTSTTAYGVQSGGPTLIDGCTITATAGNPTRQSTASGVRALDKTTTIKNSTITATASDAAYGLEGWVDINGTHGYCWHGDYDLTEAGTTEVTATATASGKKAWTVYLQAAAKAATGNPSGDFAGDYATAANATINGGTYNATASGSGASAYCLSLAGQKTQGSAVAQPEVLVNGGKFNGATAEVGTAGVVGHMQLNGGYYAHQTNLDTYKVSPKQVLPTTAADKAIVGNAYNYKIVEAYTIKFKNGESELQSSVQEVGVKPVYEGASDPVGPSGDDYSSEFDGWTVNSDGSGTVYTASTLPDVSADATYYAHFNITEKKHTVTIAAGAHGTASPASVFVGGITPSGEITATPDAGYRFVNWTIPTGVTAATGYSTTSNPIQINATADDKTITANFAAKTYTVTLNNQSATTAGAANVTATYAAAMPSIAGNLPAKTGYTFGGYYSEVNGGGTQYYNASGASAHIWDIDTDSPELYAKWTVNTHKFAWDWNGGSTSSTTHTAANNTLAYGTAINYPADNTMSKTGYTFTGWSSSATTMPDNDLTIQAQWTRDTYTLDYTLNDGTATNPANYNVETPTFTLVNPTRDGYDFAGWIGTGLNEATMIVTIPSGSTGNRTYEATWNIKTYTITFKNVDGNGAQEPHTVAHFTTAEALGALVTPENATECSSWEFTGWSPALAMVTGPAEYTATFSSTPSTRQYLITFDLANGSAPQVIPENCGTMAAWPYANPIKEADAQYTYTFTGWSPALGIIHAATTYTAQYSSTINKYDIVWKSEDGTSTLETDANVNYGTATSYNGSTPTKAATAQYTYTFDGWATSANGPKVYNNGSTPTVGGAATYYAHFSATVNNYTVTVNVTPAGYGSVSAASVASVPYGTAVSTNNNTLTITGKPAVTATPTATTAQYEYAFVNWTGVPATVTGNVTVTANFDRSIRQYEITFNMQGHGSAIAKQTIEYGGKVTQPTAPSEMGYTFGGWYKEAGCSNAWNFNDVIDGTVTTLYAKWTPLQYTVTWDATTNGGSCATASTTKDYNTEIGTLPMATKENCVFNGWFTAAEGGTQITASTKVTADVTYYAQFSQANLVATVTPQGSTTPSYSAVAASNSTADITTAWNNAMSNTTSGCTLTLYKDVTVDYNTNINKTMTIDLNGHTISSSTSSTSNTRLFYISGAYTLTIEDSGEGGMISFTGSGATSYYAIDVNNTSAVLTVKGGKIQANRTSSTGSSGYGMGATTYFSAAVYLAAANSRLNVCGGELVALATSGNSNAVYHYRTGNYNNYTYYGYTYVYGGKLKATTTIFGNPQSSRITLTGGYYSNDPNQAGGYGGGYGQQYVNIPSGYEKQQITSASMDPEYSNGYTYRIVKSQCAITWNNYDGTLITTDNVAGGSIVEYSGNTPTRDETNEYKYTFDGWAMEANGDKVYDDGFTFVAAKDSTFFAHFEATPKYAITFTNLDGNGASQTIYVLSGTMPESPVYPEKIVGDNFYAFDHWSPTIVVATAPQTYEAVFSDTPSARTYHITFDPANGGAKQYHDVPAGEMPAWEGANPTKASDAQYEYSFLAWSPGLVPATAQATYTAVYTQTTRTYTITFNPNNGGANQVHQVAYGEMPAWEGAEPTKANNTFTGWSPAIEAVSGDATYTAQYVASASLVATVTTTAGVTTPHTSWSDALTKASQNAGSTLKLYDNVTNPTNNQSITWNMILDLNGHTISLNRNTSTQNPQLFQINGGNLTIDDSHGGGSISYSGSGNTTYRTFYVNSANTLTINAGTIQASGTGTNSNASVVYLYQTDATVDIYGGELIATVSNNSRTAYAVEHRRSNSSGYKGYTNVYGGKLNAKAIFLNHTTDRTTLSGGYYSSDPGTHNSNLTVADGYTKVSCTTGDPTGYSYKVIKSNCTITWLNYDGSQIDQTVEAYGGTPTHADPTRESTIQYTYTFNRWSPTIVSATADATYTATYTETLRKYTITWKNANGTTIDTEEVDFGSTPSYSGSTPTKAEDEDYTYTFSGWLPVIGAVTGDAEYTAQFDAVSKEIGNYLDIVDATATSLTINATTLALSYWPYTINGNLYRRTATGDGTLCNTDRTISITHNKNADEKLEISVLNKNSVLVSHHKYTIPHVYESDATLDNVNDNSIIFVRSGALIVNTNVKVKNVYVAPGARLVVNSNKTLTADNIYLRTTPWASAELELNGTITGQVVYTRIISKKDQYYQFGLPMPCPISEVRLSDGSTPAYGNGWLLRSYSESHRAQYGSGADVDNWVTLTNEGSDKTIQGRVGYEMFSNSGYYREYYFPVAHTGLESTINVTRTTENTKGETHEGWNIVVSPLMRKYTQSPAPEDIAISWLQEDGSYVQEPVTEVRPAIPFSYQAKENSTISFGQTMTIQKTLAPRRRVAAAEEQVRIQWIHLDVEDANGMEDQTSIYSHPTRYEQTYKTGIDVAKQSLTASRAIVYSSHAYGEMAFAGVADSLLEQGVALTVYSPNAQELMISMRENDWLNRMEHVWLIDNETDMRVDLLESDYAFRASEGTTTGRLIIEGQFKAPQIPTDIENGDIQDDTKKAEKFIYEDKIYIRVNGRLYDSTGKLVNGK